MYIYYVINRGNPLKFKKMQRYENLHAKLMNGIITASEKTELFQLAFGADFMASENKGEKVTY